MNSRELFLNAISLKKTERAPFWIMRQAGRYLPEYRALKEKHPFTQIVKTPGLALEATLQPIRRFDFDCAILFSDILVVSEAMGFPYSFADGKGISLSRTISSASDIENMPSPDGVCERLFYVKNALGLIRAELPNKALLGFCSSPFTLAAYMVEGGSSNAFPKYRAFIKNCPKEFEKLMDILAQATSSYAKMQANCGADAVQIFDSHAYLAPRGMYENLSGRYARKVAGSLKGEAYSILFANKMSGRFGEIISAGADAYSLDSSARLSEIRKKFGGGFALQGNLAPEILSAESPQACAQKTREILGDMAGSRGHILNLGHGILPDANLENVEAFAETAKNFKYDE